MTKTKQLICFVILLINLPVSHLHSQTTDDPKIEEVRSLTQFFEYMLNAVGSENATPRDKEVIITQSYQKAFESSKVQIEDDLLDERKVITNKDITGYLRDVDFFFTNITFKFSDIDIQRQEKQNGDPYYLVSFENRLQGTSIDGESVNKTQKRYLEVNYNEAKNDLKIVSVYTTKLTRKKELEAWWQSLSYEWVAVFQNHVPYQQIDDAIIEKMADMDSLNLSGYTNLADLSPLTIMKRLKYIDISDTRISDLRPIRYSADLKVLKANNTPLDNIDFISYLPMLEVLSLSHTEITDISSLSSLRYIRKLNLSTTRVLDFQGLQSLTQLESLDLSNTIFDDLNDIKNNDKLWDLNISRTYIKGLSSISSLGSLQTLDLSETGITDLTPLKGHSALKTLNINQTSIGSLEPLDGIKSLKKVFADYTKISPEAAGAFMKKNPSILVVTNSDEIMTWWNGLSLSWRNALTPYMDKNLPQKESFMRLMNVDSLNLSDLQLSNGQALKRFKRLQYLDISKNPIDGFSFTSEMGDLKVLIASNIPATTAMGLEKNASLEKLVLKGSKVSDIEPLSSLPKLKYLDLDGAFVPTDMIKSFIRLSPGVVVIYQSEELLNWWENLSDTWRDAFDLEKRDRYSLHELTQRPKLSITGSKIQELTPLQVFSNLQELSLNQVGITSFAGLGTHENLRILSITNGPLQSINGIQNLPNLEELNVNNTAIEDLTELRQTKTLKRLNCSGTNVKKLKGFNDLKSLEFIDVSNTGIFNLDWLAELPNLKKIVCYNTRLRDYEVEGFRARFPDCEIVYY